MKNIACPCINKLNRYILADMMIFFLNEIRQKQETINGFTVEMNYKYFDFKGLHEEVETCCLTWSNTAC